MTAVIKVDDVVRVNTNIYETIPAGTKGIVTKLDKEVNDALYLRSPDGVELIFFEHEVELLTDSVSRLWVSDFEKGDKVYDAAHERIITVTNVRPCCDTHDDIDAVTENGLSVFTTSDAVERIDAWIYETDESGEPYPAVEDEEVPDSKVQDDTVRDAYLLLNDLFARIMFTTAIGIDNGEHAEAEAYKLIADRLDDALILLDAGLPELRLDEDQSLQGPLAPLLVLWAKTGDPKVAYAALASGL